LDGLGLEQALCFTVNKAFSALEQAKAESYGCPSYSCVCIMCGE